MTTDAGHGGYAPVPRDAALNLVRGLFRDGVRLVHEGNGGDQTGRVVRVAVAESDGRDVSLDRNNLPALVLPATSDDLAANAGNRVIVGVEGRDRTIAAEIAGLLSPTSAELLLLHVTWVPGTVESPIGTNGIDDPATTDLLAYEGAREALGDRAGELRAAGFVVRTHLRSDRHPANALKALLEVAPSALVVLGLGRHGLGIGRDVMGEHRVPVLYVDARRE